MSDSLKTGAGGRVLNISSIIGSRGYTGLRLADIDDISPLERFLLSDGARLITGQVILVDRGISC